ncbi:MAG: hypothetical protein JST69_06470 [Bacteroidetes bacterium]|nr:hypothetical protein [Bacteroidota bacterium]
MGLAWLFSNQLMINLTIQISDNPLDEFQEIQRMADQVRENINQLQSPANSAQVSITLYSRHDIKFKIETTNRELKRKILDSLDPLFYSS